MGLDVFLRDLDRLRDGRAESDRAVKVTVFRRSWNVPIFSGGERARKLSDQFCAIYSHSAPQRAAALFVVPIDGTEDFAEPPFGSPAHAYGVLAPGRAVAVHIDDVLHLPTGPARPPSWRTPKLRNR